MAFEPFGYRFEIKSSMPLATAKAEIRARKKSWFNPKDGPRGWIVGPLICMWMSAFDRYGPMTIALLKSDGLGTRIVGRAGADLNGTALLLLLTPIMGWITWQMHQHGQGTTRAYVVIGLIFGLGLPLTLWINSKDQKHAESLVRFIQATVTPAGQSLRAKLASVPMKANITMTVSGEEKSGPITAEAIYDALLHSGIGDSVVLGVAAQSYMQTQLQSEGFILEKREGDRFHHYCAVRRAHTSKLQTYFTFEEVLSALMAYGSDSPLPDVISWERMELAE